VVSFEILAHESRPLPNCRCRCGSKITDVQIAEHLRRFNRLTHREQNAYLREFVRPVKKRRTRKRTDKEMANRSVNEYFLKVANESIPICKAAFCCIFGISPSRLRQCVLEFLAPKSLDSRGKHGNRANKTPDGVLRAVCAFIEALPTRESHYSRERNTLKKFLDSSLNVRLLYRKFLSEHTELKVSEKVFRVTFSAKSNKLYN
jgi:hypothetical protein